MVNFLSKRLLKLTNSFPSSSRMTGKTPKNGSDAEPGFVGVQPGKGVIT